MALTDNLISYWKLDEASGTRNDSHGSNHLTDNNTVTQAAGKIADAAQFTAANTEYLSIADNADLSLGSEVSWTTSLWVYFDTIPTATMGLVGKGSGTAAGTLEYMIFADANFRVRTSNGAATSTTVVTSPVPATATWFFVVAWYDASADTLNIQANDGTVFTTSSVTSVQDNTGLFQLGRRPGGSTYLDGRLDEVGFWKRVLTTQERTDLYNGGAGLSYDNFVAAGQPIALRRRGSTEPTGARRIGRGW